MTGRFESLDFGDSTRDGLSALEKGQKEPGARGLLNEMIETSDVQKTTNPGLIERNLLVRQIQSRSGEGKA
jgi:hypothetical protein